MCNTNEVRSFIGAVKEIVSGTASVEALVAAIRPRDGHESQDDRDDCR